MDNQQRTSVQHRECCSMLHVSLGGRSLGENGCVYVYVYIAELLHYAPETIITLLTSYIPT